MTEMVKAKLNGEFEIIIPKHRADRPEWYTKQGWEKKRLKSMHKKLTSEDTIFYIGAEEGEMPALCQMWGAKVVMFEPNPKVWGHYKEIWKANKLEDPRGFFAGFASNETRYTYVTRWEGIEDYQVEGNHGFKELHLEAQNYPQIKIDDYVESSRIRPTAMSIDVEGSEFEVLKGAEATIDKYKPKIWLSLHPEFLIQFWGVYSREVRDWLMNKGYKEKLLDYQHEVHLYYE